MNDQVTELYAENPKLFPNTVIGCQRWEKDWMISFFAKDIDGKRFAYENGTDKVFDIFLDEESMEKLFAQWQELKNRKN